MLCLIPPELAHPDKARGSTNNHKKFNLLAIAKNLLGQVCGEPIHLIEVLHRYIQTRRMCLRLGWLQFQASGTSIHITLMSFFIEGQVYVNLVLRNIVRFFASFMHFFLV